jgi:hypothetical protein
MILIIGGFGGSVEYMRAFVTCLKPAFVVSLMHGVSLAQECRRINAIIESESPAAIIAFSTGCVVACSCKLPAGCRLLLCNPPEIASRKMLRFMTYAAPRTTLGLLWGATQWLLGSERMAQLYYWLHGAMVNEPRPDELARIVFSRSMVDLLTTLQTCLLEPGVRPMYDVVKSGRCRVDVLVGEKDPYQHVARALCDAGGMSARLHRIADGDHHMLYHMPEVCADRVRIILGVSSLLG